MIDLSVFENYLSGSSLSDKTKTTYLSCMRHYASMFDEVTTENVQKYKNLCLQFQSPNTVNLRLHALARYAKCMDFFIEISYVKVQESLFSESVLSRKDYDKLLEYFLNKKEYEWYIIFRLLATTGIRLAESHQFTYGDLKSCKKVIIGKGTKTRVVWLPLQFRHDVLPYIKKEPEDLKVVRHDDSYIRSKLRFVQKKLKIKGKLSPHEFRRFYARQTYQKTKDIQLIKDLLGHSSVRTTMRYLKISMTGVSRRMSRIVDW